MPRIVLVRLPPGHRRSSGHPQGICVPYTLKYLQALLAQDGEQAPLVDGHLNGESEASLIRRIVAQRPEIVVASVTPLERQTLEQLAHRVHESCRGIVIAIGQDVSAEPSRYRDSSSAVDLAFPGEAEQICAEAVRSLGEAGALSAWRQRADELLQQGRPLMIDPLDQLPFPRYAAGELAAYPHRYPIPMRRRAVWGHLLASRGCPYPCAFCTQMTRVSYGASPRLRDPDKVVEEMLYLKGQGATVLAFDDDNLTTDRRFVKQLCEAIMQRRVGLPWIAHARVDNVTPELADWMKRAGCALLRFGIESGSARIIRRLRKGGAEASWCAVSQRAVELAARAGVPVLGLFIIGSPTETEGEILDTLQFALRLPLEFAQVHFFTPYAGSEFYRHFQDQASPSVVTQQHHYLAPQVNLSRVPTQRLVAWRARFYRRFYGRPRWIAQHLARYGGFYLANPQAALALTAGRGVFAS